ncbi:MAG: hypothetical protein L0322_21410 [Chloroflexi bacterium]|nr:hypothetical protein [Chloroflexota bacterium]
MEIASDLGQLRSEHHLKRSHQLLLLVVGLFLGGAGLFALVYGLASLLGADSTAPTFFCLPIGLLQLGGAAWFLWQAISVHNLSARVYEGGLVFGRQTMRWDELASAYTQALKVVSKRGGVYSTTHTYRLVAGDGRQMRFKVFDRQITGADALNNAIYEAVVRSQWPKAVAAFQAGQTLQFGPFAVSREGVSNKKETIPWPEVEWARLSGGYVTVKRRNQRRVWGHAGMMAVPNTMVFVNLVNEVAKNAQRT